MDEDHEDSTGSEEYLEVEPEMPIITMQADVINIDDALNEHSEDEIYDEDSDDQSETSNINDFLEVEIGKKTDSVTDTGSVYQHVSRKCQLCHSIYVNDKFYLIFSSKKVEYQK